MAAASWISAKRALLADGWARDVRLSINALHIGEIQVEAEPRSGDVRVDTLLPALSNLHSHSFQRATAGMTEHRVAGRESFWTWREMMYRFVAHLTPDHIEAIAAQVFVEMQVAGYAAVGEFHYLHHQQDGTPYANIAELSERIFAAAAATGIGLTHLPVLYGYGGAGEKPLSGGQLRFGNDLDRYLKLQDSCKNVMGALPEDSVLGIAPHSLRATSPATLQQLLLHAKNCPVHIHIAEQPKEVEDIKAWLGARPVEWLLHNTAVDKNWCAIHATHMTPEETRELAASQVVAGLCPITEANLGDGPFNGPEWIKAGGAFGLGSDSNVRISLTEELRTLEYSQRLRDLERNVMVNAEGSVGAFLYVQAAKGGAQALGRNAGKLEEGKLADLVAIDSAHVSLCSLQDHQLLDGLCFAAHDGVVTDIWSAGRHTVCNGAHRDQEKVAQRFRSVMTELAGLV